MGKGKPSVNIVTHIFRGLSQQKCSDDFAACAPEFVFSVVASDPGGLVGTHRYSHVPELLQVIFQLNQNPPDTWHNFLVLVW